MWVFPSLNDISCISLSTFHPQKTREVIRQGHEITTNAEYSLQKRSVVKKKSLYLPQQKIDVIFSSIGRGWAGL
jgi:ribosomal protein L3